MGAVLRLYISDWPLGRAALSLSAYVGFIAVLGVMLCVTPAQALLSTTGYARIANQSAMNALSVAQRSLSANALGAAIAQASGPGSVAVRLVTSSVGWPALGVLAGLTLLQIVLNGSQVDAIKSGAAGPLPYTLPGYPLPPGATIIQCVSVGGPCPYPTTDYVLLLPPVPPATSCGVGMYAVPAGWAGLYSYGNQCQMVHAVGAENPPVAGTPQPATATEIADYVQSLPAADPNSMESNSTAVGAGVSPTPASSVANVPVNATDVGTTVVPASSVSPSDTVVNPSAPAPPGPQTTTESQSETTTTTTTTNPDGSVTQVEESEAVSTCTGGEHDARSFGSILQTHMDLWKGSGLAGALGTLGLLTWPTTSPMYQLHSALLGSFTFDFTAWNGVMLALRTLVIAGAAFAAYRIIFVGGSGGSD